MALQNAIMQLDMMNLVENLMEDNNEGPRFHTREDPFELSERQFISNFRLSKEQVNSLIDLVDDHLGEPGRSSALSAKTQVSYCEWI